MTSKICVVDEHHHVLRFWAHLRRNLSFAPYLITLDHHTDTSEPFRNYIKKNFSFMDFKIQTELLNQIQFQDSVSIEQAILKLSHDEHILTAIKSNIIESAIVVAHKAQDTDFATYQQHRVMCRSVDGEATIKKLLRIDCDRVLESDFLREKLESVASVLMTTDFLAPGRFILDIDLDYLNTKKSLNPDNSVFLKTLIQNSLLVTIATEKSHFDYCKLDHDMKNQAALHTLLKLIDDLD